MKTERGSTRFSARFVEV